MEIKEIYRIFSNLKEESLKKWIKSHSEYDSGYADALKTILEILDKECMGNTARKCKECNEYFIPHHPSQKFCCKKCRETYWSKQRYSKYIDRMYSEESILEDLEEW